MKRTLLFSQLLWLLLLLFPHFGQAQDTLIQAGANWRYYDQGNTPLANWTATTYVDSIWSIGAAQLGYGDGDETTIVSTNARTIYFRTSFMVNNAAQYRSLFLEMIRDDGAVVYLNGVEVWRENIAPNVSVSYNTLANFAVNGVNEDLWASHQVANSLVTGKNTIAVSMHQRTILSPDISFDFRLMADTIKWDAIVRGPYLQNATSTSMVVRWRTAALSQGILSYGTNINNVQAVVIDSTFDYNQEVLLTNLQPYTRYYYSIANEDGTLLAADSSLYFQTNPISGQTVPTTIWALGDCGTGTPAQRQVRDAYYNYIGNKHTDVLLLLGDNAYNDGTDAEYQRAIFENMYEGMLRKTTAWSCIGNHDAYSANPNNQTGPYFDIFTFPTQGEAGGIPSGTEAYYSFDYGNIHFVVLHSENVLNLGIGGAMYNWCQTDLQNTNADWIISIWHHPPYTKGSHNSDVEPQLVQMRRNFLPLLEDNGVDLVLCGHSHSYERSYFLNGHTGFSFTFDSAQHVVGTNGYGDGQIGGDGAYQKDLVGRTANQGAVYITAGSSGKKSGGTLDHPAMFKSLNELGSCVVEINGYQLDMKFIRETGQVDDYFTIIKTGLLLNNNLKKSSNTALVLSPNPSSQQVTLSTKAILQNVQIFDEQGRSLKNIQGHPSTIDLKYLPQGLYILAATTSTGEHLFQKLIVNK